MDRRSFVRMALAGAAAASTGVVDGQNTTTAGGVGSPNIRYPEDEKNLQARWEKLDTAVRG